MSSLVVIEQLQAFLVAEGVGQLPAANPSPILPSIWTMPRQGAPLPREEGGEALERATITLNDQNVSGPPGQEAWLEDAYVDVLIRAHNAGEGKLLHRTIRGLLHPVGLLAGKQHWTMGALPILSSKIWRSEQPLPPVENGKTYDRTASYRIRAARSVLAA